jgi:hypothetical protein
MNELSKCNCVKTFVPILYAEMLVTVDTESAPSQHQSRPCHLVRTVFTARLPNIWGMGSLHVLTHLACLLSLTEEGRAS